MKRLTSAPFVATNLSVYRPEGKASFPGHSPSDLTLDGLPYRRLDPTYYAWLRSRMERAKQAWQSGKLDAPSFAALRDKFNAIHDEAVQLFGEASLLQAVHSLDPRTYPAPTRCSEEQAPRIPGNEAVERTGETENTTSLEMAIPATPTKNPVPDLDYSFRFPEADDPALPVTQPVRLSALAKVRAIESLALSAGWTLPELYQNRGRYTFPCGGDYGIVCHIAPEERLGHVTSEAIELIARGGHSLHFRRQAWKYPPTPNSPTTQTKEAAQT